MKFIPTEIPEIMLIEMDVFEDRRGFFMESYHAGKFAEAGISANFVQDNHSGSGKGVLRGMHYQIRHPQGKLVSIVSGEIYDVTVDLRRSSPTFGKWVGVYLSPQIKSQLWVHPGFAHGFYVLSEWAEICYKATDFYAPEWERTLLWNDPEVGIEWPLQDGQTPFLSDKDAKGKLLAEAEVFE